MRTKIKAALLIEALLERQPLSIRQRLAHNEAFGREFGLGSYQVIEIAGIRMRQEALFSAARKVSTDHSEAPVRVMDEGEVKVRKTGDQLVVEIRRGEAISEAPLEALGLFAEEPSHRINAFERIAAQMGPTVDLIALRQAAQERPLSDDEVGSILSDLIHGVSATQAGLETDLRNGKARLKDLMPDSLDYFDKFCGPDPGDLRPDEYLGSILPDYRKTLLHRDLQQGLEICLVGALRDDLCPAPWLSEISNDQLWECLQKSQPEMDPFSLLAALDLALYRQDDERFLSFAERAVSLLAADEFPRSDGVDEYQLIPVLAKFILNRIQLLEGGALRPPFWKRMCAWMQAALIAQFMHESGVHLDSLTTMIERNLLAAGGHANTADLRREPMVEAGTVSRFGLRREILGRLVILQARHQATGKPMPRVDEVRNALEKIAVLGPPLSVLLPGPLDGYRRPHEQKNKLPEEYKEGLLELSKDVLISNLVNISQHYALSEDLKVALRETISAKAPEEEREDVEKTLARLWHSATVAAAERDGDLAQVIAASVLRVAAQVQEESSLWTSVETLLRAAAAYETETAWAEWLERQFFELTSRLPAGKILELFWQHMQEVKKITRLEVGIFGRAEAVASAGALSSLPA